MIKILIIGCGPHATHFYLPSLLALTREDNSLAIAGVLDILPQKEFVLEELSTRGFRVDSWFVAPFAGDALSSEAATLLNHLVDSGKVNAVIISTDPLNHVSYAQWALSRRLPILLDKPVSTCENAVSDLAQARKIEMDYEMLLRQYQQIPSCLRPPFVLCAHRRYHPGILSARRIIADIARQTGCPVTSIRSMHSDGQWRMPHEILTQKHHSYNQGYGKVSHSGFHFIDCVCEFWKEGLRGSKKNADEVRVFTSFVRASGLLKQLTREDYCRLFHGYPDACPEVDEQLEHGFSHCGEIDAEINMTMCVENVPFSLASIGLLHNSYSQRSWLNPNRDLYKGNGRVKHEEHIINLGPFVNIQIHSYQSKDQHVHCSVDDEQPGGNNHFELYVFRNSGMIGGKPFERFALKDIDGAQGFSSDSLFITQIKKKCILEWLEAIKKDRFSEETMLSAFSDHRMSVRLMSAIYQSYCFQQLSQDPIVSVPWSSL